MEIFHVHDVHARHRERGDGAAASLEAQAQLGALAHVGEIHAAPLGHVALAADVILWVLSVLLQRLLARAAGREPGERAAEAEQARNRVGARGGQQVRLKRIRVVRCFVVGAKVVG